MTARLQIVEARTSLVEALTPESDISGGVLDVLLINEGWGSSGYYPAETLEAAAKAGVFAAGTHMYIDHPSVSERHDRPERSLTTLAGTLLEEGYYSPADKGIRAKVKVYSAYRGFLAEAKDDIGVSVRGSGEYEVQERDGRRGRVFTELTDIASVDYVTHPGRGGRIVSILESHRPAFAEAKSYERREQLGNLVREQHGGEEDTYTWVRDFDDAAHVVWFDLDGPDSSAIYQQEYAVADDVATELTGDRIEVRTRIEYVPVTAGSAAVTDTGTSDTDESRKGTTMPEISEARLAELTALEESAKADRAKAEEAVKALALRDARDEARPIVEAALKESELPDAIKTEVAASVLESGVELDAANKLDERALKGAVTEAVKTEEKRFAAYREALGEGKPRTLGWSSGPSLDGDQSGSGEATEAELDAALAEAFPGHRSTTLEA